MADQLTAGPQLDCITCEKLHAALAALRRTEDAAKWEPFPSRWWRCACAISQCNSVGRHECPVCGAAEQPPPLLYPEVSTDANVAFEALKVMRGLGYAAGVNITPPWYPHICECSLYREAADVANAVGATPSEAICHAIVAALPEMQP